MENKTKFDPYAVLGVAKGADDEEIKRAYRKLSLRCHPDMFPDDPSKNEKFRTLKEAYDLIDTEAKRRNLRSRSGLTLHRGADAAVKSFFDNLFRTKEERQ